MTGDMEISVNSCHFSQLRELHMFFVNGCFFSAKIDRSMNCLPREVTKIDELQMTSVFHRLPFGNQTWLDGNVPPFVGIHILVLHMVIGFNMSWSKCYHDLVAFTRFYGLLNWGPKQSQKPWHFISGDGIFLKRSWKKWRKLEIPVEELQIFSI